MSKILIIDDDIELCEMLTEYLTMESFSIATVNTGDQGADKALAEPFDAIILDVMLPGMNGFDVLRKIRQSSNVPIIMLTAKGDDIDRILGLENGADDYLPKPFNPRELVARLKAILRRTEASKKEHTGSLQRGPIRINPSSRKAFYREQELILTSTEFIILYLLLEESGLVVTKETLYEKALGRPISAYDRSIDMHISHLRKKLPHGENLIVTVRGSGYQLIEEH